MNRIMILAFLIAGCAHPVGQNNRDVSNVRTQEPIGSVDTEESTANSDDAVLALVAGPFDGNPVWSTFIKTIKTCSKKLDLGTCEPYRVGVVRKDTDKKGNPTTCHYSGRAADVGGFKCTKGDFPSQTASGKMGATFNKIVGCARAQGMKVLYWQSKTNKAGKLLDATTNHRDHGHFSLGCSIPGHPKYI